MQACRRAGGQECSGAAVQRRSGAAAQRCRRCLPSVSLQKSWMESELSERKPCAKYTMAQHNRNGVPKAWRCRPSQVCAGGAALARAALATALARGLEGDFERGVGLEGDLERGDGLAGDLEREGGKTGDLERRVGMVPFFSTTLNVATPPLNIIIFIYWGSLLETLGSIRP